MPSRHIPIPVQQWTDPRHRRGYAGERSAMAYLLRNGWRIEAHRFRLGHHDLDLVARRDGLVVFVEVKTRTNQRFGSASEAVGWRKRAVMTRLAGLWIARFGRSGDSYRFDVITVEGMNITHIEGAWIGVGK